MLLSTIDAANAALISLSESLSITSTGNNGPVVFDFGVVSTGITATYGGSFQVSYLDPGGGPVTILPLNNGTLGTCPSSLSSGGTCIELVNFFFSQTPSTLPGIYSGQQTLNYSFLNAAGAQVTDPVTFEWSVNVGGVPVPGPIAGAGSPGLVMAGAVLLARCRRRRHHSSARPGHGGGLQRWLRRRQKAEAIG
jgi:hypothetical protein